MRRATIAACLALICAVLPAAAQGANPDLYALDEASASLSSTQAGAHADFTNFFSVTEDEAAYPHAETRDVIVALPPGLVGNPEAFPKCTTLQLGTEPINSECPQDSQIGSIDVELYTHTPYPNSPIYNMPAPNDAVARFGFFGGFYPGIITVRLNPETNSLVGTVEGIPAAALLLSSATTFWGVPAATKHDPERLTPLEALEGKAPPGGSRESTQPTVPFMTNPTSCEGGRTMTTTVRSYERPEKTSTIVSPFPQMTGCTPLEFNPTATAKPSTSQAPRARASTTSSTSRPKGWSSPT